MPAERPFRAPPNSASSVARLGGGDPLRPVEISLAHLGCLFLDELAEFARATLEGLREPLESGPITVCRAGARATFPVRTLLVGAFNPCPRGFADDPRHRCTCSAERVRAYRYGLSGPLLDRFDVQLVVRPVPMADLCAPTPGESSAAVAERVARARAVQRGRFQQGETRVALNAALAGKDLDRVPTLDAPSQSSCATRSISSDCRLGATTKCAAWRARSPISREPTRSSGTTWPRRSAADRSTDGSRGRGAGGPTTEDPSWPQAAARPV